MTMMSRPARIKSAARVVRQTAAVAALLAIVVLGAGPATGQSVTNEVLLNAQDKLDGWVNHGRNYGAWRFFPGDEINRDTVNRLAPAWIHVTGVAGGAFETTALVNDGRMYITTPNSHLICLDVRTGKMIWRYDHDFSDVNTCCGPHNKGVALLGDKVYWATLDARLMCFDARSGQQLWDAKVADHRESYSITVAPLVVKDKIIIGISGGEFGIRGFLDAFDANTGERVWRFYTIPGEGEPGNDTWSGDSWKRGGAPTWVTGTYDPELDLIYWGTGNPSPDFNGEVRMGDNLYSNTIVALHADSGELAWHFQSTPHDVFDLDATSEPIVMDEMINGELRKIVLQVNRNGYVYALDRATGEFLYAHAYTKINWAEKNSDGLPVLRPEMVEPGRRKIFPGILGGKNWPPASYNPDKHMVYIPEMEWGSFVTPNDMVFRKGIMYMGGSLEWPPWSEAHGYVTAFHIPSGTIKWKTEIPKGITWAGTLATGGGLVFAGAPDGNLRAFHDETGEVLWKFQTGTGLYAPPICFTLEGKQYIGIAAGHKEMRFRDGVGGGNQSSNYILFSLVGD
jgi:alcohol dehydrogenase (cytochrome c)